MIHAEIGMAAAPGKSALHCNSVYLSAQAAIFWKYEHSRSHHPRFWCDQRDGCIDHNARHFPYKGCEVGSLHAKVHACTLLPSYRTWYVTTKIHPPYTISLTQTLVAAASVGGD